MSNGDKIARLRTALVEAMSADAEKMIRAVIPGAGDNEVRDYVVIFLTCAGINVDPLRASMISTLFLGGKWNAPSEEERAELARTLAASGN